MPAQDRNLVEALSEWVVKAENDLKNGAHTLKLGRDCPTDTVCFHAQQCVEKYIKALLVLKGVAFPKTHNIRVLLDLLEGEAAVDLEAGAQNRLTDYATVSRYPGEEEPITLAEARQAVRIARGVRRDVRKLLPRSALRRRS